MDGANPCYYPPTNLPLYFRIILSGINGSTVYHNCSGLTLRLVLLNLRIIVPFIVQHGIQSHMQLPNNARYAIHKNVLWKQLPIMILLILQILQLSISARPSYVTRYVSG
jgi:hypothetical protein